MSGNHNDDVNQMYLEDFIGRFIGNVELTRSRLNGAVMSPLVVVPPRVSAGNGLGVDLLPASSRVALLLSRRRMF